MQRRTALKCGLTLASSALVLGTTRSAAGASTKRLFVIARSKNANLVCYDARLEAPGKIRVSAPVAAYWTLADRRREPLTWLEQQLAYGYRVSGVTEQGFEMRLSAFEQRLLRIEAHPRRGFAARTTIAQRPAFLERVFVSAEEGGVLPSVKYVELHGTDVETGTAIRERIEG